MSSETTTSVSSGLHGEHPSTATSSATQAPAAKQAPIRAVSSEELLGARGELHIDHQGRQYRLRRTQNGKLILTA